MEPPAFSIFSLAEALMASTLSESFLVISPSPRILTPSQVPLTRPAFAQAFSSIEPACVERLELAEVDRRVGDLELRVVETALGQTADEGHLAAFETEADAAAGAGLLALVALAAGLAVAGAFAAAEALDAMARAGTGLGIMKSDGSGHEDER